MARGQKSVLRHRSVVRTTMYFASMDFKTAFDEARSSRKDYGRSEYPVDNFGPQLCSSVWRASSHSIDVSKESSKLPDCGRRWP